jgi:hypothetical protein
MTLKMRLPAALVLGAGLAVHSAALAQGASAAPAPPTTPPNLSPPPSDPRTGQPTYAVPPPHDSSSGLYLPAVVGGYVKSTAGCVVAGCDNGPSVSAPSSPGAVEAPPPAMTPANPGSAPPQ